MALREKRNKKLHSLPRCAFCCPKVCKSESRKGTLQGTWAELTRRTLIIIILSLSCYSITIVLALQLRFQPHLASQLGFQPQVSVAASAPWLYEVYCSKLSTELLGSTTQKKHKDECLVIPLSCWDVEQMLHGMLT